MSEIYLTVKDLQVESCNVSTTYLTNAFPTAALIGLIDNFRYQLSQSNHDWANDIVEGSKSKAFAIVKTYSENAGKKGISAYAKVGGAAHKKTPTTELQIAEATGNLSATLVFALEVDEDFDDDIALRKAFSRFMKRARFAGGRILPLDETQIDIATSLDKLKERLAYERGWCATPAYELFDAEASEIGAFEAMQSFAFTFKKVIKEKTIWYRKHPGWLFFTLQGYQFLESPAERAGVRGGYPHVLTEPVISLNQLKYFRESELENLFWCWKEHPDALELVACNA